MVVLVAGIRSVFVVSYGGSETELERLDGCLQHLNYWFVWTYIYIYIFTYINTTIIDSSMTMIL